MKRFFAGGLSCCFLTAGAMTCFAFGGNHPAVNPKSYGSSSGKFVWKVDPTETYGRGEASYQSFEKGAQQWSGKKPFTLYEAGVTDDGLIAGYAYSQGIEGGGRKAGEGEFHVVIMRMNGELLLDESIPRKPSQFLHADPVPLAKGLIIDGSNDRLVIRMSDADINRRIESWWTYQLSSGKAVGKFDLKSGDPNATSVLSARTVKGIPLTLLHYWRYQSPDIGARFALVDTNLQEIWNLTLARDYNVPNDEASEDLLRAKIWSEGAILRTASTNQFEIFMAASSEGVTYRVQRDRAHGKWLVEEIGRRKHVEEKVEPTSLKNISIRPLKVLGTFTLRDGAERAIRDIMEFDIDDRERFGFLRREPSNQYSFVLLASDGKVLRQTPLPIPEKLVEKCSPKMAWLKNDRWIVIASDCGVNGKASAWWWDASSGDVSPVPDFVSPQAQEISSMADGGFVVLAVNRFKHSMTDELIAFDENGKRKWSIKQDHGKGDQALFSPEDVAVTTVGEIAVIDNIRDTIQFYSGEGKFLRIFKLKELWGREPNYPSDLTADIKGGVLVKDFNGKPPFVRMDSHGKVISKFMPKHPDGRIVDVTRGMKVTKSGSIWVSDGECFIRLNADGVSDLVWGVAPNVENLETIAAVTTDQNGRLYAVDERTGTVHVYDKTGSKLRICEPEPTDFSGKLSSPHIAVDNDGTVYLNEENSSPDGAKYLQFSSDGTRLGFKKFSLDNITEKWFAFPKSEQFLVLGYRDAFLADANGKVLRTIQRRPDGNWLEHPDRISIGANGSFAILTGRNYGTEKPWQANVYNSTGDPIRTIQMPAVCMEYCSAYSGKYLVARTETEICLFDSSGEPLQKFSPTLEGFEKDYWECFTTFDGREVWFVCRERKTVTRFELP